MADLASIATVSGFLGEGLGGRLNGWSQRGVGGGEATVGVVVAACRSRLLSLESRLTEMRYAPLEVRFVRFEAGGVNPTHAQFWMAGAERRGSMNGALPFSFEPVGRRRAVCPAKDCLSVALSRSPTCGLSACGGEGSTRDRRRVPPGSDVPAHGFGLSVATVGATGPSLHRRLGMPSNGPLGFHGRRRSEREAGVVEVQRDAGVSREIAGGCRLHFENRGFAPHMVAVRGLRYSQ